MPLPLSSQDQLRAIREDDADSFAVTLIDVCLSSFLQDHHHRDGELLLGVYVDGSSTVGDVLNGLESEYSQIGWDIASERKGFDDDKALAALAKLRADNAANLGKIFDSSLDGPPSDEDERFFDENDVFDEEAFEEATREWERESDMGESCQAWFLIHWDVPDDEED